MIFGLFTIVALLAAYRLFTVLPNPSQKPGRLRNGKPDCSVAIFLGSGGHTSEALALLSALDVQRFSPRIYLVSSGDDLSVKKAVEFEAHLSNTATLNHSILLIPRARRVHQSLVTTPLSAAFSLLYCVYHLGLRPLLDPKTPILADLLILNGPGTCFVLCVAVYINKFFGLQAPYVIYVETFARVKSLSLSGKLLRPFADKFITQWPEGQGASESLSSEKWFV